MAKVSLKWCPTAALKEFADHQWHYMTESMETVESSLEWLETMQAIRLELDERGISATLQFSISEEDN